MELVGPKYRIVAAMGIQYFFAIGYVLLTGIAYIAKDWKYIEIAMSVPSFVFLCYYWYDNFLVSFLVNCVVPRFWILFLIRW